MAFGLIIAPIVKAMQNKSLGIWAELSEGEKQYLLKLPPKKRQAKLEEIKLKKEKEERAKQWK